MSWQSPIPITDQIGVGNRRLDAVDDVVAELDEAGGLLGRVVRPEPPGNKIGFRFVCYFLIKSLSSARLVVSLLLAKIVRKEGGKKKRYEQEREREREGRGPSLVFVVGRSTADRSLGVHAFFFSLSSFAFAFFGRSKKPLHLPLPLAIGSPANSRTEDLEVSQAPTRLRRGHRLPIAMQT